MRVVVIFAVIALLAWRWRAYRSRIQRPDSSPPLKQPTAMLRCRQCGLHIPDGDSVTGSMGVYCCQEHRAHAEG